MSTTRRLRAYNWAVNGWTQGRLKERDIDILVRAGWITEDEGVLIKALRVGDLKAAEELIARLMARDDQGVTRFGAP